MRSGEAYCYSEFMTMLATDWEHCRSHYNFVNLYDDDENALSEEGYCDVASHSIAFKCSPRWPRFVVLDSTRFYRLRQLQRWRFISLMRCLMLTFNLCHTLTGLSYNACDTGRFEMAAFLQPFRKNEDSLKRSCACTCYTLPPFWCLSRSIKPFSQQGFQVGIILN